MTTAWSASIFTADLSTRIDISAYLLSFDGVVRHLAAGEWDCKVSPALWDTLRAHWPSTPDTAPLGLGIQIPGQVVISGAINTARREVSAAGAVTLTLSGVDEFAALDARIVYPQPADLPPWNISAYHTVTGQASAAVAEIISRHAGVLARVERRMAGLVVRDNGVGPNGTWKYRLPPVGAAVAAIAAETGLAIRVRRRLDAGLDVDVTAAINRTAVVLDDSVLGNSALVLSAATATTVIAAGSGEATARLFAIAGDAVTGQARREVLSDQRNIDNQTTLERSAEANRAADSASTSFIGSLTTAAADLIQWRRDYDLGDTITLRVGGATWPITVTGVVVTIDGSGLHATPILGSEPQHVLDRLLRDVDDQASRLNNLEVS